MFNIRFGIDYLLHRLTAKTRHGTHSPFVYKLVDEVIYDFPSKNVYNSIEEARKRLLHDKRRITVIDLGAGSHINNKSERSVTDIAKNAVKSPRMAQLIYRLAAYHRPENMIELGTSLGFTTLYLQTASPLAAVYTLEGCPEVATLAKEIFKQQGADKIKQVPGNFDDTLQPLINSLPQVDFVYIDGNHYYEATMRYFNSCLPKVHEDTVLIFDDIYWSEGMKQAWTEIKAHPQVTATIDLFWTGLVYFRKGQAKEDFKIRL